MAASSTFSATPSRARRNTRRIADPLDGGGTDGFGSRAGSSPGVSGTLV
jgi:hypothetical protein